MWHVLSCAAMSHKHSFPTCPRRMEVYCKSLIILTPNMAVQLLLEHHMRFLDKSSKGGNRTFVCINCGNKYNGSQTRQLAHLLGPKGKGIAVCNKINEDARQELLAIVNRVNGNAAGQASTCIAITETGKPGTSHASLSLRELHSIFIPYTAAYIKFARKMQKTMGVSPGRDLGSRSSRVS